MNLQQQQQSGGDSPPPRKQQGKPQVNHGPLQHFIAGATGGVVAAALLSPLDILRTRLQARNTVHLRPDLLLKHIVKTEGILGLYRGLLPTMFGVGPARALYFGFYSHGKQVAGTHGWGWSGAKLHLSAAVAAGIATNTIMSPWWVIRLRLQLQTTPVQPIWVKLRDRWAAWQQARSAGREGAAASGNSHTNSGGSSTRVRSVTGSLPGAGMPHSNSSSSLPLPYLAGVATSSSSASRSGITAAAAAAAAQATSAGSAAAASARTLANAAVAAASSVTGKPLLSAPQAQSGAAASASEGYKGIVDCFLRIYREEGPRAFYRGLTASYLGVFETVLQFALYGWLKERIVVHRAPAAERELWAKRQADAAAAGEGGGGGSGHHNSHSGFDAAEVARAAYSGHWPFLASAASKLVASAATYPHEVIRTRMREQRGDQAIKYRGIVSSFRTIWAEEGVRGLYGGLSVHLLRTVPNAALLLWVVEHMVGGEL